MALSVIICASALRGLNLWCCLQQLTRQTEPDFEVVVVDDGSEECGQVVARFDDRLQIRHLWRSNDRCQGRSRNLGITAAKHEQLVFIDADIVLNPQALAYYRDFFSSPMALTTMYCGYFGSFNRPLAPSFWFKQQKVNFFDLRFVFHEPETFALNTGYFDYPYQMAWGGNFAVHRQMCQDLNGFSEAVTGWGSDDEYFALRVCQAGYQIRFTIDTWAEHQDHRRNESFHQHTTAEKGNRKRLIPDPKDPAWQQEMARLGVVKPQSEQLFSCSPESAQTLGKLLRTYYYPAVYWQGR